MSVGAAGAGAAAGTGGTGGAGAAAGGAPGAGGAGAGAGAAGAGAAGAAGGAPGVGGGAVSNPPAGTGGIPEWIKGITKPELRGLAEARRWESPEMLVESFHNLEKLRGIPADKILAIPESTDQPALDIIYNRLGRPDKPEAYSLPKDAEGSDTNKWLADTFHKTGLSAVQAKALFDSITARQTGIQQKATDKVKGEVANQLAALKTEWGAAFAANEQLAANTLAKFGLDGKAVAPLKDAVGGVNLMKFLVAVGKGLGEGTYIAGSQVRDPNGPMTPLEAKTTIKEKMADQGFIKRFVAKDSAAVAEMERLQKWAHPEAS